ncbi:MAG: RNB domain-containing ribonuclease [Paludibacteraceae bacterium]|nr:RNB domain-containing ribonuclease [Paludibacteraceae bacterium]
MAITEEEILRRRDFRGVLTFTIDPADAKDFDDALSLEQTEDGNYRIGVHIADVTHYVKPGDDTDKEAYDKATSVYLVDRVIPMLPEELCNDLCSLRPKEDKLCMSVIFNMNSRSEVLRAKVSRTVICSDYRLTYGQAQALLEDKEPEGIGDNADELRAALKTLNGLAIILRRARERQGALMIEQEEPHFRLDEEGNPVEVYFTEPQESNHLIEEFMLLANRTVAEQMARTGKTMVYRVHDKPNEEKLDMLERFKKRMGDRLPAFTEQLLTIRAMAKAVYSTDNIGHYGLAFDCYTHFTSPIRRYPDMMVHRLVSRYLLGERKRLGTDDWEEACKHCSEQEQAAAQAERDSIKEMQARWIKTHVGEEFDGYISGVTDFGLFVTLNDSRCDGLVPLNTICPGMFLNYDEKNCCLQAVAYKGRRKKKMPETNYTPEERVYTLGDKVRVRCVRADVQLRQIDFRLVENAE